MSCLKRKSVVKRGALQSKLFSVNIFKNFPKQKYEQDFQANKTSKIILPEEKLQPFFNGRKVNKS